MLVALLVIAAVSGGVLGLVYGVTKDTIAQVDQKKNEAASRPCCRLMEKSLIKLTRFNTPMKVST